MAKCAKCGKPLTKGRKVCPSCGTPVKQAKAKKSVAAKQTTAKKSSATARKNTAAAKKNLKAAKKRSKAARGAGMGKIAVIAAIAACAVTALSFFLPFFAVSFAGSEISVNGMEAAVSGFGSRTGGAFPALLLVGLLAIALILALCVHLIRQKPKSVRLPIVIVALIGLIVLFAAYALTTEYLKREFAGYDEYLYMLGEEGFLTIDTGVGFIMAVFAQILLLVIPLTDKLFTRKRR